MLYLIKIGYQRLILPNDDGIATLMRVLSKARFVDDDHRYRNGGITTKPDPVEVAVEPLPGFKLTHRSPVLDPEVLPAIKVDPVTELNRMLRESNPVRKRAGIIPPHSESRLLAP